MHALLYVLILFVSCTDNTQPRPISLGQGKVYRPDNIIRPGPTGVRLSQGEDKPTGKRVKVEITIQTLDDLRYIYRDFLDALSYVESNHNDKAVGDNGNALGRYQIWKTYWKDAIEFAPVIGGTYKDVHCKVYAERIVIAYLIRYKAKHNWELKNMARIHNGGPNGNNIKATEKYWDKVRKVLG